MREHIFLLDRQRIQISPEPTRPARIPAPKRTHHARAANPHGNIQTERTQPAWNMSGYLMFLIPEFR